MVCYSAGAVVGASLDVMALGSKGTVKKGRTRGAKYIRWYSYTWIPFYLTPNLKYQSYMFKHLFWVPIALFMKLNCDIV